MMVISLACASQPANNRGLSEQLSTVIRWFFTSKLEYFTPSVHPTNNLTSFIIQWFIRNLWVVNSNRQNPYCVHVKEHFM